MTAPEALARYRAAETERKEALAHLGLALRRSRKALSPAEFSCLLREVSAAGLSLGWIAGELQVSRQRVAALLSRDSAETVPGPT